MRSSIVIFALLPVFVSCMSEQKKLEKVTSDEEQEKQAITATLVSMWDAIEKGNVERYASSVHPEFTQFGEMDSILKIGKEIEISGVAEWIKSSEGIHTEMDDPLITIKGDVAWITYYWRDKGITNGEPFTSRGKSTRIFVKEEGKWLCIHGHYTLL
ncbi:YybH family protein [Flagellimonas sp. 2504JD4-2]